LKDAGLSGEQAVQALDITIWHQAMMLAANNITTALSVIIALTAIGIWAMPKIAP
jgi:hypothetical protein